MITIWERLHWLASGNRNDYIHKNIENKKTRKLQDFLDEYLYSIDKSKVKSMLNLLSSKK